MDFQGIVELSHITQMSEPWAPEIGCGHPTKVEVQEPRKESTKETLPQFPEPFLGGEGADSVLYIGAAAAEQTDSPISG